MARPDPFNEGLAKEDLRASGSNFADVREALLANPYQEVWGAPGEPPFPVRRITLSRVLAGVLPFGRRFAMLAATRRSVASNLDLRWGDDGRGFRRLVHANGICLLGRWEIDRPTGFSGCFREGSSALVVARLSACCTETRSGHTRSLGLVGRLYPTTDPDDARRLPTANFITQEDIGGNTIRSLDELSMTNAPDTTAWRRGWGLPVLMVAGLCSLLSDRHITERQLYQIAELGKDRDEPTRCPRYLRLTVRDKAGEPPQSPVDFRDEVMGRIYDQGDPRARRELTFRIEVADEGTTLGWLFFERRRIRGWREVGSLTFSEAVASTNGDRVVAFQHPVWRRDRNLSPEVGGPS